MCGSGCAGKPTTPAPPTPEIPQFVSVVLGSAGESCTALCEGAGRKCAEEHLASLNNCNVLREHFACEAGCAFGAPPMQQCTTLASSSCMLVSCTHACICRCHVEGTVCDLPAACM